MFQNIASARPELKTVGDADDELRKELNASGHYKLRYWGAPGGFAVVVPLEPIDDKGRPLVGPVTAEASWAWGSIIEEIRNAVPALVSGSVRRYHILLFIISDDQKMRHPEESMTADTGRNWEINGAFVLPKIDRSTPLTSDHMAAVFVYEFEKDKSGNLRMLDRSNLPAIQHLRSANLKWFWK